MLGLGLGVELGLGLELVLGLRVGSSHHARYPHGRGHRRPGLGRLMRTNINRLRWLTRTNINRFFSLAVRTNINHIFVLFVRTGSN